MPPSPPLICVVVDSSSSYGRDVLRGVFKYANIQRRWLLDINLWHASREDLRFPECEAAILVGAAPSVYQAASSKARHLISCSGNTCYDASLSVTLDDDAAGRLAADHLMDCNLKHFAFYPRPREGSSTGSRCRSFSERLGERGFPCDTSVVERASLYDWISEDYDAKLAAWLHQLPKPVGIFAASDNAALDVAKCCQRFGILVPDEVAIIGVNNDELICEGAWPPLTSIEPGYDQVGYRAAELLDRLLSKEGLPESERTARLPPLGVVQRTSTSVLSVSDPLLADAIGHIRKHACDPCNVQDVLRHVPITRRQLERRFADELGRTPHQEIMRVRIDNAARLLVETNLSVAAVASKCGFPAVQNLYGAFRTRFGATPAAYRRSVRDG